MKISTIIRFPLMVTGVLVAVMAVSACGVQVDSSIAADRKATVQINATIHPVLQAYLAALLDTGEDSSNLINAGQIRARLLKEPGLTVNSLEADLKTGIKLSVSLADIQTWSNDKKSVLKDNLGLRLKKCCSNKDKN